MQMKDPCIVHKMGIVPYEKAWNLQSRWAEEIAVGVRPPTLMLLEHPHTFTFGRRGKSENLLWDEEQRESRGISVYWVDRGGDVTYHGPGQLVGYPLLPLAPSGLSYRKHNAHQNNIKGRLPQADYIGYMRKLETIIILALSRLGVISAQMNGLTGVWVQPHVPSRCTNCPPELKQPPAKIAAIGLKVDVNGISRHGFALNVNPDMSFWDGIVGCGLADHPAASIADMLSQPPSIDLVSNEIVSAFGRILNYEMVDAEEVFK